MTLQARRVLVASAAKGPILRLEEPLSLWGGYDPQTGEIVDRRHPQSGLCGAGHVWCLRHGRGSSSASSILLESVRSGHAPAALLLCEEDGILALGAAVAMELYGRGLAVLLIDEADFERVAAASSAEISVDGRVSLGGSAET